jgi:hypothetical protein
MVTLSFLANLVLVLHLLVIMCLYGGDACNALGVGRIDARQGRELLGQIASHGGDLEERFSMAVLITFRVNLAAWSTMFITSIYGLVLVDDTSHRIPVHLQCVCAYSGTMAIHIYHLLAGDDLVPSNDPYHKLPLVLDSVVMLLNLAALLVVVTKKKTKKKGDSQAKVD